MTPTGNQLIAFRGALCIEDAPDFTIECDGFRWPVHSSVISKQSRFFDNVCHGGFKESEEKEVHLGEVCPWIVGRMIQFFYIGTFDTLQEESNNDHPLHLNEVMQIGQSNPWFKRYKLRDSQRPRSFICSKMYVLADKYGIEKLLDVSQFRILDGACHDETDFFKVADNIGITILRRNTFLLSSLLLKICGEYVDDPSQFPRLRELIRTDSYVSMAMIDSMKEIFDKHSKRTSLYDHKKILNVVMELSRLNKDLCKMRDEAVDEVSDLRTKYKKALSSNDLDSESDAIVSAAREAEAESKEEE